MKYTITAAVSSQTASERTYEIEANSEDEALRTVLKSGKEILSEDIEDYVTCITATSIACDLRVKNTELWEHILKTVKTISYT